MIERSAFPAFAQRGFGALALVLGLLFFAPATSSADEVAWMYDPDAVVEIHLGGLSEEELDALEAEPDEYQQGTFELKVDGVTKGVPLADVGIRRKGGAGSARPIKTGKSGLKVRFDEFVKGQLFFGLKRLTLNNMIQDPSMVHETLSYELFRALDLPASRTGYAFVTLNGEKYGLFLNLETLDKISLPHWFASTQHLYEADAPGTDVTPGDVFEVDEGDEGDIADLEALIAAANDTEGDWSDGMAATADLAEMTRMWAVERFVAHWDGYAGIPAPFRPNNYYLHSDASGIFRMMPWGTDQTWERDDLEFDEPAGGVMFNNCFADPSCAALYVQGLTDVHCAVQGLGQGAHAAQLAAMLGPYQDEEDEVKRESTPAEIAAEVESVEDFAALRAEQLADYLTEQGVLGAGIDPCVPPSEPEKPAQPGLPPSSSPIATAGPGAKLSIGRSRALGNFVTTRLFVPTAGVATQRVSARLDGRRVRVCSIQGRVEGAGQLTLRCRLSVRAREALRSGSLRLRVRIGVFPVDGTPQFDLRRLTLPKRP